MCTDVHIYLKGVYMIKIILAISMAILLTITCLYNFSIFMVFWLLFNLIPCVALFLNGIKVKLFTKHIWKLITITYCFTSLIYEIIRPIAMNGFTILPQLVLTIIILFISWAGLLNYTFIFFEKENSDLIL